MTSNDQCTKSQCRFNYYFENAAENYFDEDYFEETSGK